MTLPKYSPFEKHWNHHRDLVFLNHGSFGSCPTEILNKQSLLKLEIEKDPVQAMTVHFEPTYHSNKKALADFVHCDANDVVFVNNATQGVNTILHSLTFNEGDELLTHNHAYGACVNTLQYYANKFKCKVVIAKIPFPISDPSEITSALLQAVTNKTKLVLIDHVTSPTGIIFPVKEICEALEPKGIEVLVDGAHAPGMLDLNIEEIGASYYTGNCHKWICSPRGSALLHVRKDKQEKISPLQISHHHDLYTGTEKNWSAQFIWPGTGDYSAYLFLNDSISFMGSIMGNWNQLREHNRNLCLRARNLICAELNIPVPSPDSMIGHIASIPLSQKVEMPGSFFNMMSPIRKQLLEEFKIQIPVFMYAGEKPQWLLRISSQAYNSFEQYEYLVACLKKLKIEN